jgi:hypothetical protein
MTRKDALSTLAIEHALEPDTKQDSTVVSQHAQDDYGGEWWLELGEGQIKLANIPRSMMGMGRNSRPVTLSGRLVEK